MITRDPDNWVSPSQVFLWWWDFSLFSVPVINIAPISLVSSAIWDFIFRLDSMTGWVTWLVRVLNVFGIEVNALRSANFSSISLPPTVQLISTTDGFIRSHLYCHNTKFGGSGCCGRGTGRNHGTGMKVRNSHSRQVNGSSSQGTKPAASKGKEPRAPMIWGLWSYCDTVTGSFRHVISRVRKNRGLQPSLN